MVNCHLCPEEKEAIGECVLCGKPACAAHRWVMLGLCHACASEEEVAEGANPKPPRPQDYLDIKWIE